MSSNPYPFKGLSDSDVAEAKKQYGTNSWHKETHSTWLEALKGTVSEPMFVLLVACTVIYFSLGEYSEGFFMLGAIILVSGISFYQDSRSRRALEALKTYTEPLATVIRNNHITEILSEDIVIGDIIIVTEGELIPADGTVIQTNDFSVNESILTGEAFTVYKSAQYSDSNTVFQGTSVASGQCVFEVTAIGQDTQLGKIGTSLGSIKVEKTPLQIQIDSFVKKMAGVGIVIFLIIWGIHYYKSQDILDSLLKGLTIAMSVLPEEIPVAFASFMALGAWRLMKKGIIVKQTQTVEALGSATVLCTDKTGTITENRMELHWVYVFETDSIKDSDNWTDPPTLQLIQTAMFASEVSPFDPMEKAIHQAYAKITPADKRPHFKMIHEYPLSGSPPIMTHIFAEIAQSDGISPQRIVACKGAVESLIRQSVLSESDKKKIHERANFFANQGLRVLGVGRVLDTNTAFPSTQHEFSFQFLGLIGFYDPPKHNIAKVFKKFYDAGIQVKIITGDSPITTLAIAQQAQFRSTQPVVTGEQLMNMTHDMLEKTVVESTIFTRMFPEAKLTIIETLKNRGEIVGMTGDGVNDGPALKAAHIGIAMGKRGTEIAKQAASLILIKDDFGKMIDAVAMGRKIYNNLKKAIQYIISIHIPIILTVALPLILGWIYPAIFTPVHVIFLELIMGPTCSIVYENEPLEKNSMNQPPRPMSDTFLNLRELTLSIIQGLVITSGTLFIYQYAICQGYGENLTRTMVFTTLVIANIFLTLVNRSFYYSIISCLKYKNNLLAGILLISVALLFILIYTPAVGSFFKLIPLRYQQFGISALVGFVSVIWFEGYKWSKRLNL